MADNDIRAQLIRLANSGNPDTSDKALRMLAVWDDKGSSHASVGYPDIGSCAWLDMRMGMERYRTDDNPASGWDGVRHYVGAPVR